MVSRNKTF